MGRNPCADFLEGKGGALSVSWSQDEATEGAPEEGAGGRDSAAVKGMFRNH